MKMKKNVFAILIIGMMLLPICATTTIGENDAYKKDNVISQGFEAGVIPPAGWTHIQYNPVRTWEIDNLSYHSGAYAATCLYDETYTDIQNEWLITPSLNFSGYDAISLSFWWLTSYYWSVEVDNCTLNVSISTDNGTNWELLWNEDTIGEFDEWIWYNTTFNESIDLSEYIGEEDVLIGFQYYGYDGAQISIDDILISFITTTEETNIYIEDESPADNSTGINISQSTVSVNISATHVTSSGSVSSLGPIPFNWTMEGQYVQPAGGNGSTAGMKTANLTTPLPYSTEIIWYVNVTANDVQRNEVFSFTTEEPPNQPPVASYNYTINDRNVSFDSSSSDDSDGTIVSYEWNFGDGNTSTIANPSHNFREDDIYTVVLTVTDNDNATKSKTQDINVTNNPPVANFTYAIVGGTKRVNFDSSSSSDVNGTIVSYFWEFGDGTNATSKDKSVNHEYTRDYTTYQVNLTVTDGVGSTDKISKPVTFKDMTNPTIKIDQPLKGLYVNGKFVRKFFIRPALIIGDITIKVNASDSGSGIKYVELWIGKDLKENKTTGTFDYVWTKDRIRLIHLFKIKVVAYDNEGNSATKTMFVKKYL